VFRNIMTNVLFGWKKHVLSMVEGRSVSTGKAMIDGGYALALYPPYPKLNTHCDIAINNFIFKHEVTLNQRINFGF